MKNRMLRSVVAVSLAGIVVVLNGCTPTETMSGNQPADHINPIISAKQKEAILQRKQRNGDFKN